MCTQAETTCPLSYIMIKVFIAQDYLSCLLSVCISSMTRYEDQILVAVRKSSRAALTRQNTQKQNSLTGGEEDPDFQWSECRAQKLHSGMNIAKVDKPLEQ